MGLKPGYKQTEVGVIPEDWEVKSLGDFLALRRGHDLTESDRRSGNVPVLGSGGPNGFHDIALVKGPGLVLGRSGASFGQAQYCDQDFWPHNTVLYVTDFYGHDRAFAFYLLKSINFTRYNSGGAQQSLNRNFIAPILVLIPPLYEQQAIAEALGDTDALIESLEQLIARKRAVKQGAMQKLLTGKRRLPGFGGEWLTERFGNIAALRKERANLDRKFIQELCIELENVDSGTGLLVGSLTTENQLSQKLVFQAGDVLFGKLRAYLRKYWLADRSGVCSTEFWVFVPVEDAILSSYLLQLIQMEAFIEAASISYGTHMPRSDWNVVRNHSITLPCSMAEQSAIAAILTDMDDEIAALESKLAKARRIREGMMAELLTGRTRLV